MLLDGGLQFKERRVSDRTKKREMTKEKEQSERRTHRLSVRRKMIAHDIGITRHGTLSSKAIRTISTDRPREMWRVNELTGNRFLLLQFSTLGVMINKVKEMKRRRRRLSIYPNNEGRHETSDVELLIVQPLKKPLGIGNTTPL